MMNKEILYYIAVLIVGLLIGFIIGYVFGIDWIIRPH